MRVMVEAHLKPAGDIIGPGINDLRWPHSMRPGDELRLELLEGRRSRARPVTVRTTAPNQKTKSCGSAQQSDSVATTPGRAEQPVVGVMSFTRGSLLEASRHFSRASMRAHPGCLPQDHLPSDVVLIRLNTLPS